MTVRRYAGTVAREVSAPAPWVTQLIVPQRAQATRLARIN